MIKKRIIAGLLLLSLFTACTSTDQPVLMGEEEFLEENQALGQDHIPVDTPSTNEASSSEEMASPEMEYPEQGYGPEGFPDDVNPLTGLSLSNSSRLERRPIIVKVENMPRERSRPQWGLSRADHVYEYYIEAGDTRFGAVYYGNRPGQVGPIRSARHFDIQLIDMYKASFIFGGAYPELYEMLLTSDFGDRLIREGPNTAPMLYRYEPDRDNQLMADLSLIAPILDRYEIDDSRQELDGLFFQTQIPDGGEAADSVYVRFSGAVYNRWDFDEQEGAYFRFSDAEDDVNRTHEVYQQLTDQLTGDPISAQNVVILMVQYESLSDVSDVFNVNLIGSGRAYIARDGKLYSGFWQRSEKDDLISLVDEQKEPFPLKPGQTWFEVINEPSQITHLEDETAWRFTFIRP